jgi:hypothetical protein
MVVEEAPVEPPVATPAEPTPNTEPTTRTQALAASGRLIKPAAGSMDLDTELDQLFADEHSLAFPETLDEADDIGDLDLDLTNALSDTPTGIAAEQQARGAEPPSRRASDALVTPVEDTAEHLDLQSLATSAEGDEKLSQTLMEALTLLERDYEDELTASQVVDLNALRQSVADEDDDTAARTGTGSRRLR